MSSELVQTGFFDLELDTPQKTWHIGLEDKLQDTLRQRAAKIKAVVAQANFIIGQELTTAQQELAYRNGGFRKWVEEEIGIDNERAYEFIRIWEGYKMCADSAHILEISKSVLLISAKKDVPESARQEIVTRNEAGEKITLAAADEIIERHKAEVEAAKKRAEIAERANESAQQQALFYKKEAELTKSERDGLLYQLEHLPAPEPQTIRVEVEKEVLPPDIKEQIAALQDQIAMDQTHISEKEAKITALTSENGQLNEKANKNSIESQTMQKRLRIHQNWGRINDEVHANVSSYLRQVPDLFDPDVFEEKQYAHLSQTIDLFKYAISSLEKKCS